MQEGAERGSTLRAENESPTARRARLAMCSRRMDGSYQSKYGCYVALCRRTQRFSTVVQAACLVACRGERVRGLQQLGCQ